MQQRIVVDAAVDLEPAIVRALIENFSNSAVVSSVQGECIVYRSKEGSLSLTAGQVLRDKDPVDVGLACKAIVRIDDRIERILRSEESRFFRFLKVDL